MGSDHPSVCPYGTVFEAADGKLLVLAVGADRQFRNLCAVLQASTSTHTQAAAPRLPTRPLTHAYHRCRHPHRRHHHSLITLPYPMNYMYLREWLSLHGVQIPELGTDDRFATNPSRVVNRDALIPLLRTQVTTETLEDWSRQFLHILCPFAINRSLTGASSAHGLSSWQH